MTNLSTDHLRKLLTACKGKDIFFDNPGSGILIRHDVDDDLDRSVKMAELENEIGVKATYFILNTERYWNNITHKETDFIASLHYIQSLGHSIQWHNNSIAELKNNPDWLIRNIILEPLNILREIGFDIKGSASHGDKLCHQHGFINYEVFSGSMGERTREAVNFKKPDFEIPKINPADFGLEWEAYHVPYDEYYSESGGRWKVIPDPEHIAQHEGRVQLLLHPQWHFRD